MKKSMAVILLGSALLLPTTIVQKLLIIPMVRNIKKRCTMYSINVYKGEVVILQP